MVEELKGEKVLLEKCRVNYAVYRLINGANKVIDRMNPTASMKAVKNDVEIENEKRAHIKDGVAMTKFIYWLKKNMGRIPMDEISVSDYLEKLRMDQEVYRPELCNHIRIWCTWSHVPLFRHTGEQYLSGAQGTVPY